MSDKQPFNNKNIKAAIDKSGMTREQIADKIGCDTSSVTKYYNGGRYPKTDIIIKMAELFNCSTDYLLGISDIYVPLKNTQDVYTRISCDYTGLNEKTVGLLFGDVLHSDGLFSEFVNLLFDNLKKVCVYNYMCARYGLKRILHIDIETVVADEELAETVTEYLLARYELSETFSQFLHCEKDIEKFINDYSNYRRFGVLPTDE